MLHKPAAMIARGTTVIAMPTRIFFKSSHPSANFILVTLRSLVPLQFDTHVLHFAREYNGLVKLADTGVLTMQPFSYELFAVIAH
jgi:hypothetical protein